MACRRKAGSVEVMVHSVITSLSPIDIEDATGKTTDLFYKVSNPNHQQQLSLKDAVKLDLKLAEIGKDAVFFKYYQIAMQGLSINPGKPMDRVLDLMKEMGEAADAVHSMSDKQSKLREAYDVLDAAQNLINALEGEVV